MAEPLSVLVCSCGENMLHIATMPGLTEGAPTTRLFQCDHCQRTVWQETPLPRPKQV